MWRFPFFFKKVQKFYFVWFSQSKKKCGDSGLCQKEVWRFRFVSKRSVAISCFCKKNVFSAKFENLTFAVQFGGGRNLAKSGTQNFEKALHDLYLYKV